MDQEVMLTERENKFLGMAIELSRSGMLEGHGGPFGCIIVKGDEIVGQGFNRVTSSNDPTSHFDRWTNVTSDAPFVVTEFGYPNAFDRAMDRTGSYILVHGGCSSIGCYAMTDPVIDEVWRLVTAALKQGQRRFHVHIFPFGVITLCNADQ